MDFMDPHMWANMFHADLSILEKILRPVIIYFFLVIGLRLSGKRELAQLNPFDLVVLLTLSNTVQNAIIGNDNSVSGGIIGATALLALNWIVNRFLYGHEKVDRVFEGDSTILMEDGQVIPAALKKELITMAELTAAAHRQSFGSLDEVSKATLEPGGTICFIGKKPDPDTARHVELLGRLEELTKQVSQLRTALNQPE